MKKYSVFPYGKTTAIMEISATCLKQACKKFVAPGLNWNYKNHWSTRQTGYKSWAELWIFGGYPDANCSPDYIIKEN